MLELTIRLIVSLAIVVGLLLLLARISARRFGSQKGALVQVVHRQPLSRTSAVSVVSVGSRVLVLGTTEHRINVLAELDPEELESQGRDAAVLELVGPGSIEREDGSDLGLAPAEVAALLGWPEHSGDAPDVETDARADPSGSPAPAEAAMLLGKTELPSGAPDTVTGAVGAADVVPDVVTGIRAEGLAGDWPGSPAATTPEATAGLLAERLAGDRSDSSEAAGTPVDLRRSRPAGRRRAGHRADTRSTGRRSAPATRSTQPGTGALAGSVLSPQTWRQALAAVTRRAS